MLLYNKHIDKYATLISRDGDRYTVRYEGDTQIYVVPSWVFGENIEVNRPWAASSAWRSRSRRASQ
jgi:hypothetical protein